MNLKYTNILIQVKSFEYITYRWLWIIVDSNKKENKYNNIIYIFYIYQIIYIGKCSVNIRVYNGK